MRRCEVVWWTPLMLGRWTIALFLALLSLPGWIAPSDDCPSMNGRGLRHLCREKRKLNSQRLLSTVTHTSRFCQRTGAHQLALAVNSDENECLPQPRQDVTQKTRHRTDTKVAVIAISFRNSLRSCTDFTASILKRAFYNPNQACSNIIPHA